MSLRTENEFLTDKLFDIDKNIFTAYNINTKYFQGGVKFPTGSKVCEPRKRPNRRNSDTDG